MEEGVECVISCWVYERCMKKGKSFSFGVIWGNPFYLYFNIYRQIIVNFVGFNVAACSALGLERGGIRNVKC